MKKFMNDDEAIGKWQLLGVSKTLEEGKKGEFVKDGYSIDTLYLMPNGENYWVISWNKNLYC